MEMHKQILIDFMYHFCHFLDADEPQPHLPVSAMTTKASPESVLAAKPAQSSSSAAGPCMTVAPTGDTGEYSATRGTLGAKETKFQESGAGAQTLPHLPLTAVTKSSSETAPSKADQSPTSIPESPKIKRGDYPFRRGGYNTDKAILF